MMARNWAGITGGGLIGSIFDSSVPKTRYMACSLRLVNVLWGCGVAVLAATASGRSADPRAAGSLATLFSTVVLLPLVENAVFLLVIELAAARSRAPFRISLIAALAATLLHAPDPARALCLFGGYFVTAAVFLAWRDRDRSFGFWLGVALHGLFNTPAALLAFLG